MARFDFERYMRDPDRRAKLAILVYIGQIFATISIVLGTLLFITIMFLKYFV